MDNFLRARVVRWVYGTCDVDRTRHATIVVGRVLLELIDSDYGRQRHLLVVTGLSLEPADVPDAGC
jgi:hypothetical protein